VSDGNDFASSPELSALRYFFQNLPSLKKLCRPRQLHSLPIAKSATGCQVGKLYYAAVMQ